MGTGELYMAQGDGSRPTILVHGHVPGESGVSVVNLRFRGGLHLAAGKDLARVAEQRQAAVWITSACVRVAEGCFELAGSRAVYESSSLQRRVRDLRVAAQHVAAHPRNYVAAGAAVFARMS
jgi:hypothetical protein